MAVNEEWGLCGWHLNISWNPDILTDIDGGASWCWCRCFGSLSQLLFQSSPNTQHNKSYLISVPRRLCPDDISLIAAWKETTDSYYSFKSSIVYKNLERKFPEDSWSQRCSSSRLVIERRRGGKGQRKVTGNGRHSGSSHWSRLQIAFSSLWH